MSLGTRVIVQRDDTYKDKYYPTLVSATTNETFPWSCPTATINVLSSAYTNSQASTSPIRKGDIIRLQVNLRQSESEKNVWQDLFHGRIHRIGTSISESQRQTSFLCRGHGEENLYKAVTSDYSAASTTTGAMLLALQTAYETRITDATTSLIDSTGSTAIGNYNIQAKTRYVVDAIKDFEELEGYGYIYSNTVVYDSDRNLSAVYGSWQALPTTVTDVVKIVGGKNVKSADFYTTLEGLVNDVTIYGISGSPQKTGNATDATSIAAYNTRHHIATDQTILTDALCLSLATAIKSSRATASGEIHGTVTILGNPNIELGMLVPTHIEQLELEGAAINDNFRVCRKSHSINADGFTTSVDLGELILTDDDIMADFHTKNRLNNSNLVD